MPRSSYILGLDETKAEKIPEMSVIFDSADEADAEAHSDQPEISNYENEHEIKGKGTGGKGKADYITRPQKQGSVNVFLYNNPVLNCGYAEMGKVCGICNEVLVWPKIFSCYYCQQNYCEKHRIAENHNCPKVTAAKNIEKDYLRRKGVSITTGKFAAVCKVCGFTSDYYDIEEANQKRIDHIKEKGCEGRLVQLRENQTDAQADLQLQEAENQEPSAWMYDCLKQAEIIVEKYDSDYIPGFLQNATFSLYVQHDRENAYGYITVTEGSRHFPIGIHPALSENNSRNARMLVVVLVHELLHAVHPGWNHDRINPKEKLLANKAGYFDALREMEILAVNGRMRFCTS